MKRHDAALREALFEAAQHVRDETGGSAWAPFEEPVPADAVQSARGKHAVGFIEGAAIALGMTPIELLDEYGVADAN